MKTKLIRHVRDLVGLVRLVGDYLHVMILRVVEVDGGPRIACLSKATLQDLHDAVGIGMATHSQRSSY